MFWVVSERKIENLKLTISNCRRRFGLWLGAFETRCRSAASFCPNWRENNGVLEWFSDGPPALPKGHGDEAGKPVADLDESDDGDPGEEAEGAADGRNHVEDGRPHLQRDPGYNGGVEEEVENGNVASKTRLSKSRIGRNVVDKLK